MPEKGKFRLVTRSDFDGLACAVLLRELGLADEIVFVHPKDVQDGKVEIGPGDITTNLPYAPGAHLAFDHHGSELERLGRERPANHVIDPGAPSAARVVYDHYGGASAFPNVSAELMDAVDKGDSAQFSRDEILHPHGWPLLNFIMDARTGLGRFRDFRVSNYHLMMELIDWCREHDIDEILEMPDVRERVDLYFEHEERFRAQLERASGVHGPLLVIDLRDEDPIWAGNRFYCYALFPQCDISMHVLWGRARQNTVFAIGKSIIDRGSPVNVGKLCLEYGGGGHAAAGTCQVANERAEQVRAELVERICAVPPSPARSPARPAHAAADLARA